MMQKAFFFSANAASIPIVSEENVSVSDRETPPSQEARGNGSSAADNFTATDSVIISRGGGGGAANTAAVVTTKQVRTASFATSEV